jgi:hypothetical protein
MEPAAKAPPSDTAGSTEEARGDEFDTPNDSSSYSADVASLQAESAPAGVSRTLTEMKTPFILCASTFWIAIFCAVVF